MYDLGFDLPSRLIMSQPPTLLTAPGAWTPLNSTLAANAVVAPDGTTTASTITATSVSSAGAFSPTFTMLGGVVYALSAYISSLSGPWSEFQLSDLSTIAGRQWFDPNGGVVGSNTVAGAAVNMGAFIKAAAGGFFLATMLVKIPATNAAMVAYIGCQNANGAQASTASQVVNAWHPTVQPLT